MIVHCSSGYYGPDLVLQPGRLKEKIDFLIAIKAELSDGTDPGKVSELFSETESIAEPKILILDSLDVLAGGRMPELHRWLSCLNKLKKMPFVAVVCACRSFEAEHLYPLNVKDWSQKYPLDLPDNEWIRKVIESTGCPPEMITDNLLYSLKVPLHLRIAVDILDQKGKINETETMQSLYTQLFELQNLGEDEFNLLGQISNKMVENRSVQIPLACITVPDQQLMNTIGKAGIIVKTNSNVRFFHQTLIDFILGREIINKGKSLRDFLLEHNQSLFVRPIIRHILMLLRPIPRRLINELEQIFLDESTPVIRTHIKVGILANMASWTDPSVQETEFLLRIFGSQDGNSLMSQFFSRIAHKGWFLRLKDRFLIPSLKEEGIKRSVSLSYIQAMAKDYPNEVLDISLNLLNQNPSPELEFLFSKVINTIDQTKLSPLEKGKYAGLIEKVVQNGFIEYYYEIQRLCTRLSRIDPGRGLDLFFAALKGELERYNDQSKRTIENSNSFLGSLLFLDMLHEIEQRNPFISLVKTLDFLEDIFRKNYLNDVPDTLLYAERSQWFRLQAFYHWFKKLALDFSKIHPQEATQLIQRLKESNWNTQRQLAYLCMLQAPQQYTGEIREHMYSIFERKLDEPSSEHENQLLLQLLSHGFIHLAQVDQQRIMAKISSLSFEDDIYTKIWVWRPLHHIPESLYTPAVKERLQELDSRFGAYRYEAPFKITGGAVVSPVPKSELEKMEPDALHEFLIANRNLKKDIWQAEDDVVTGGTEELAREAAELIAGDFEKYQQIINRFLNLPENDVYLKWFLAKFWEKEISSDYVEWSVSLILKVWDRKGLQLEIARGLVKMAEDISDDQFMKLKPILIALASAPDPEEDRFIQYRKQGYGNDALTEGINSIRGIMCEAILRTLNRFKDSELVAALERLAQDETISVRAALVYYLPLGVKALGWDKCFGLFSDASQRGLEEYMEVAGRFLQYVPSENFPEIETLLDSWVRSGIPGLLKTAISLASVYYLRDLIPSQKICEWLDSKEIESELKKEALEILANHMQFEHQVEKVLFIFDYLLSRNSSIIVKPMNIILTRARSEDLNKIRSLIENIMNRSAILRDLSLYYLLGYLEKCLLIDPRSSFEILEKLLSTIGNDINKLQDYMGARHSKSSLNILNTIFECFWDLEDRALQVLDRLIELNWGGVDEYLKAADRL